jgi:chemotaxis protein methyltransferase CheR
MAGAGVLKVAEPARALSEAEYRAFRQWLFDCSGINLGPRSHALLTSRLGRRLSALGLPSYQAYLELLRSGTAPDEAQMALDLLTTNETYFFREPKHFELLARQVLPTLSGPVRIWCAASSSGEEPYTLAMTLAETLGLNRRWEILASDISSRVLAVARRGLYPLARAQRIPPDLLKRWCLKGVRQYEGSFLVDRRLRERVSFASVNLVEPLPDLGPAFDAVFVRNVMIYFDAPTKQGVLTRITERLKPGGWLFVSHSENLHGMESELQMQQPSIYRRRQ